MPQSTQILWQLLNDNADGSNTRFDMLNEKEVTALESILRAIEDLRAL